jgi:hypothetical protein
LSSAEGASDCRAAIGPFVAGLDLAESYYWEVVQPRLATVAHSAALMGAGSDVLGYDDLLHRPRGGDRGCRCSWREKDRQDEVRRTFRGLPDEHQGWPTRIGSDRLPLRQHVDAETLSGWLVRPLGVDPGAGLSTFDSLTLPQSLLGATSGRVFHDGLGELEPLRAAIAWYPRRRVALAARLPVAADRPGGGVRGPGGGGRR